VVIPATSTRRTSTITTMTTTTSTGTMKGRVTVTDLVPTKIINTQAA
jgi:hypothetical protein